MPDAPALIHELVERFRDNRDLYMSQNYNEEQTRAEFIGPFFEALGWDVPNRAGNSPAYMDVVFEGTIRVEGNANAPDYTFRVGQTRKFFVEAKKPAVRIEFDPDPARQIRRCSWNAKLPLGIVTNFHELAVYDCRVPLKPGDKASYGRLNHMKYTDYPARWDEIAAVFSKDAVWKGAFDRFAAERPPQSGTAEVDEEFLKQIEEWRALVAHNLALRNPALSVRELNYAVQSTIDRIVFLRICEDRGTEEAGRLLGLTSGPNTYRRLLDLYYKADDRYNSGLFHFRHDPTRHEAPDGFTPNLTIDDNVLKDVISALYWPKSPYDFSIIGVDILGNVYEQFLGKVISLTPAHKAVVDEKPEVKKAGGVYYTPTYIVDYIVKNTVGKLCEGKTPKQVEKLRILDPACGSGSFLINAYAWLLNWHLDYYVKDGPDKHKKEVYRISGSEWRLTTRERKGILLNNIYGVDIDSQAVEVTKLSLLLKVLEGESAETLDNQLRLLHERALPDLSDNIKCGNSLIGTDFDTGGLGEEDVRRINPFDWDKEFPEVMKNGGFDAVIGNPPYGAALMGTEKAYLLAAFPWQSYQLDSYQLFLEQAIRNLLRESGYYGMIVPNPWLTNLMQERIRRLVLDSTRIVEIVHFRFPVFRKVTVDTEIVVLQRASPDGWTATVQIVDSLESFLEGSPSCSTKHIVHSQEKWRALDGDIINIFSSPEDEALVTKCHHGCSRLDSLCDINVGIKPYQVGKGDPPQTAETVRTRPFDSDTRIEEQYRAYLRGSDIARYAISPVRPRYIRYGVWLAEPRPAANFDAAVKILMRQTGDSLVGALDTNQYLCLNNMHVLVPKQIETAPAYMLGVVNSRLLNWLYHAINPEIGEALAEVKKSNVSRLPIRTINFDDPADKARYDKMVELVDRMLDLHKKLAAANVPGDKTAVQRQIDATDREIDKLVYELYGLTEEEIRIVEEGA